MGHSGGEVQVRAPVVEAAFGVSGLARSLGPALHLLEAALCGPLAVAALLQALLGCAAGRVQSRERAAAVPARDLKPGFERLERLEAVPDIVLFGRELRIFNFDDGERGEGGVS